MLKGQNPKSHCSSRSSDSACSKNQIAGGFIYILELEAHGDNILHSWLNSLGRNLSLERDWMWTYLNQFLFPRALFQAQPLNYFR